MNDDQLDTVVRMVSDVWAHTSGPLNDSQALVWTHHLRTSEFGAVVQVVLELAGAVTYRPEAQRVALMAPRPGWITRHLDTPLTTLRWLADTDALPALPSSGRRQLRGGSTHGD